MSGLPGKKKIVLITPGQPNSNPRVIKEATALFEAGFDVTVIYNFWVRWADKSDEDLFRDYPGIKWIRVGGHPVTNKGYYFFTRIRSKLYKAVSGIFPMQVFWQKRTVIRCYAELNRAAVSNNADLYIAHNLGSLAPAAEAAKKK